MVKISDAELEVMKIVWEKKEVTSAEIIRELKEFNWSDNTVRTLINRLVAKKAVGVSNCQGKTYTYVPLIKEDEYKLKRSLNFVKQFYHGSAKEMVMNFVDSDELSKDDLQYLMKLIDEKMK